MWSCRALHRIAPTPEIRSDAVRKVCGVTKVARVCPDWCSIPPITAAIWPSCPHIRCVTHHFMPHYRMARVKSHIADSRVCRNQKRERHSPLKSLVPPLHEVRPAGKTCQVHNLPALSLLSFHFHRLDCPFEAVHRQNWPLPPPCPAVHTSVSLH